MALFNLLFDKQKFLDSLVHFQYNLEEVYNVTQILYGDSCIVP